DRDGDGYHSKGRWCNSRLERCGQHYLALGDDVLAAVVAGVLRSGLCFSLWKHLPACGPDGAASVVARRMFDRKLDLHTVASAADFEFEPARAGNPPARRDSACDAASATAQQLDVVWTKVKCGRTVRCGPGLDADSSVLQP